MWSSMKGTQYSRASLTVGMFKSVSFLNRFNKTFGARRNQITGKEFFGSKCFGNFTVGGSNNVNSSPIDF